jgi:hypothetical protein
MLADIDRVQLAALASVQRRSGLGVAVSSAAFGQVQPRWLTAAFYLKFAMLAVLGLLGATGVLLPSLLLGLVFSYTLIMLILGLTLLGYFTTVLLDTSDNRILLHLPISGRTLLAARILCIAKYAGLLAVAISLPTALALAIRFGAVALLVFAASLVLTLALIVAATLAICLLALRYVEPAQIRQGILYFETAVFVLAIFAGSAVLNADVPLMEMVPDVAGKPWWYFYPPAWMAGLLDYSLLEKTQLNSALAATAVVAPVVGFIGCIRSFAGGRFTALLSRLEVVSRSSTSTPQNLPRWLARASERISILLNGDRQQRAVFDLTSKLMKTDQTLKLTTYPYIGTILVNIGFVVWEFGERPMRDLPLAAELTFFMFYYMPLFLAIIAPWIQYSAEWRAAWCYQVLPFSQPGVIVAGAMKAYLRKYILPIYVLLLIVSAVVWGITAALDVLFAGAVATLVCVYRFWSAAPVLPYSRERVAHMPHKDGRRSRLAFIPIVLGLIATHAVLKAVAGNWGVAVGIVATAGAIVAAYGRLRLMRPKDVEAPDRHIGWHRPQN